MFQTMCLDFPKEIREKKDLYITNPNLTYYLAGTKKPENVTLVTTPKSGTHLLIKILNILGVSYKSNSENMSYAPHICQYGDFLPHKFLQEENLKEPFDLNQKYIVTIRDPKDFIISYIQWLGKEMSEGLIPEEEEWKNASMEEKLDQLLAGGQMKFSTLQAAPWYIGNYLVAEKLMHLALPHILFLRFEDLIGPELGGSSKEKQIDTLTKLCQFTGTTVTDQKLDHLIKLLPGNTLTYIDQKKVGKWKDYFTEKHIQM